VGQRGGVAGVVVGEERGRCVGGGCATAGTHASVGARCGDDSVCTVLGTARTGDRVRRRFGGCVRIYFWTEGWVGLGVLLHTMRGVNSLVVAAGERGSRRSRQRLKLIDARLLGVVTAVRCVQSDFPGLRLCRRHGPRF
jgi:hypothetical protein